MPKDFDEKYAPRRVTANRTNDESNEMNVETEKREVKESEVMETI
jgi:hypothetical protein